MRKLSDWVGETVLVEARISTWVILPSGDARVTISEVHSRLYGDDNSPVLYDDHTTITTTGDFIDRLNVSRKDLARMDLLPGGRKKTTRLDKVTFVASVYLYCRSDHSYDCGLRMIEATHARLCLTKASRYVRAGRLREAKGVYAELLNGLETQGAYYDASEKYSELLAQTMEMIDTVNNRIALSERAKLNVRSYGVTCDPVAFTEFPRLPRKGFG